MAGTRKAKPTDKQGKHREKSALAVASGAVRRVAERARQVEEWRAQLDQSAVAAAIKKKGVRVTRREQAQLNKYTALRDELVFWKIATHLPKVLYRILSGRPAKITREQAARYGLPLDGEFIDLAETTEKHHDLLAQYGPRVLLAPGGDPLLEGASQALKDEYVREQIKEKREKALLAKLDRREREDDLVERDEIRQSMGRLSMILRSAGERLRRQFGEDACEVLEEALDDFEREVRAGEG